MTQTMRTPKTIETTTTMNRYNDGRDCALVLVPVNFQRYPIRQMICFTPAGSSNRRVMHGPILPGPFADTFPLGSYITSDRNVNSGADARRNRENGIEHDVTSGDIVIVDGVRFVVQLDERGYITLRNE